MEKSKSMIVKKTLFVERTKDIISFAKLKRCSVNDLLIASFYTTIKNWNKPFNNKGNIIIMVPVNLRKRLNIEEPVIGNLTSSITICLGWNESDKKSILQKIKNQRITKIEKRVYMIPFYVLSPIKLIPISFKEKFIKQNPSIFKTLITTTLSNKGKIDFGKEIEDEINIIKMGAVPPCSKELGLTMGILTYKNQMSITLRSYTSFLSPSALEEFLQLYINEIDNWIKDYG